MASACGHAQTSSVGRMAGGMATTRIAVEP
jgi:hypothetical protein